MKRNPKYHPVKKKRGLSRKERKNALARVNRMFLRGAGITFGYDPTLQEIITHHRQTGVLIKRPILKPRIIKISRQQKKLQYKIHLQ